MFSVLQELEVPELVLPDHLNDCPGLPRSKWITKFVTLLNDGGDIVAEGICQSVDSKSNDEPLGEDQVVVQIVKCLNLDFVPADTIFGTRTWQLSHAIHGGWSLLDHLRRHEYNAAVYARDHPKRKGVRPYELGERNPRVVRTKREEQLLTLESVNLVASKMCCSKNCCQPFPREKIMALRKQMYESSDFKFKAHFKIDVHNRFHQAPDGSMMVTTEGIDVCARAWQHITGVPPATFYRKKAEATAGLRARHHGNVGQKKPRLHVKQAVATLKTLIDSAADHMPHKAKMLTTGVKVVSRSLPSSFKWKDAIPEINDINERLGLKCIAQSTLSKIRKTKFSEYSKKAPGDNFARCSTCDRLESMIKSMVPESSEENMWIKKLKHHLDQQETHREYYYTNRSMSIQRPRDVLCIIHDKMDHAKTACPLFSHKTKANDALMKLPIAVTGMIAHGHSDVRYAHYGLDIYPSDCNHTVGSILKLLRDLEGVPISYSKSLFAGSGTHPLFEAVLFGKEGCLNSLLPESEISGVAEPLPPVLHVQLDNAASDNKNRFMFCFWSLLVHMGVFREVYVNFLLVGHTHEDIDALFGRWSMILKEIDFLTIPLLMKSFMDAESLPVIPHLIEEIPDFKGYIKDYIASREEILVGHSEGQQFKFYKHDNGWPMMQYKMLCSDNEWLPSTNGGIKLWKEDANTGLPLLPTGEMKPLAPIPMKNRDEIVKGIAGFIKMWETSCAEDISGEFRRRHDAVIRYWRAVKLALVEPMEVPSSLKNGCWPLTRVSVTREFLNTGELREEYGQDPHFIGRLCDRPRESFRVGRDVFAGYFLALRPADGDARPFWIARALSDFDVDHNNPGCIQIQYFKPATKSNIVQDTYVGWDTKKGFKWKVDDSQNPEWLHGGAIFTSWKSSAKPGSRRPTISISERQIDIIRESIQRFDTEEE